MSGRYVIGVDFGTLSGRAVLVDAEGGRVLGWEACEYPHGVMDHLPDGTVLKTGWALQDPADYILVLKTTIPQLLQQTGVPAQQVEAIGFDATSCTMVPVLEDGTPLCRLEGMDREPHSYVKLWKHVAAQPQAEQLERFIRERNPELLNRYGGKVSSQWMVPKILQLLQEAPEVYSMAQLFLDLPDWLTMTLTGKISRNTCSAGFKTFYDPGKGCPMGQLLPQLDSRLADLYPQKLRGDLVRPWESVGTLLPQWAEALGLTTHTKVAAGIIDAHAGVLGSGITREGEMLMILGTSACVLLLQQQEAYVPGICGSCLDGILPELYGYEAGQACVGDMLDWYVRNAVPESAVLRAKEQGLNIHQLLTREASTLMPGESGLVALDWWNGQRTPLVDDELSGLLLGMTVRTTPAEIYRALLEAAAFGARAIVEGFEGSGIHADSIIACGGICEKNALMMQIYADVLGKPLVTTSGLGSVLGAAVLAASAAEIHKTPQEAIEAMIHPQTRVYTPNPENVALYQELYQEYQALTDWFGRGGNNIMHRLRARSRALGR